MYFDSRLVLLVLGLLFLEPLVALPVKLCGADLENQLSRVCGLHFTVPEDDCCQNNQCHESQLSQFCLLWSPTATTANKDLEGQRSDVISDKKVSVDSNVDNINIGVDVDVDVDNERHRRRFRRYVEVSRPKPAPAERIPTTYSGTGNPEVRPRPSRLFNPSPSTF